MADIGVWQPDVRGVTLNAASLDRLARASDALDAPAFGLSPADVLRELERREGESGLEEFAARKAQNRDKEDRQ